MFTLLKLLQSLIKALNSEGTPGQVAAGFALGAAFGLTPLMSVHNLLIAAAVLLLNVSVPGAFLGWMVAVPLGFLLDPAFDAVGSFLLLHVAALQPLWRFIGGTPVLALTNLTNSVTLGSLLVWAVAAFPVYVTARYGVTRYRATVYQRLQRSRVFRGLQASKLYNVYRLLRP